MKPRTASGLCGGSMVALALLLVVGGCSPTASKGTLPPPGPNGDVDPAVAPDFIAVTGRDGGIAGYAPKRFLFPEPAKTTGLPVLPDIPVYAEDLRTVVGHMVAGKGFVAIGVDAGTVPEIHVQQGPSVAAPLGKPTGLTLYVRSAVAKTAWFAINSGAGLVGGQGNNGGLGVGCIDIGGGDELVMLDRAPQEPGALVLRTIYTHREAAGLPTLWVDIGADGMISQGTGVPGWWQGEPQAC
jgi:hypothetical protein